MVRVQLVLVTLVAVFCGTNVEARGRRTMRQPVYQQQQYYNTVAPTNVVTPSTTNVVMPANAVAQPATGTPSATIVQTSAVDAATGIVQANSTTPSSTTTTTSAPVMAQPAAVGSAQWKAEQSARMGSVAHIGGGFGGGSYEGNGFGPTADQAIRNACFWGQRTPIEIGVARGANGYYATIFYR